MLTLSWSVMGLVFFAVCQEVSPVDSGNVNQVLQEISDLKFLGHGTSYAGLVDALPTGSLWSIPTIVDGPAFARNGIDLDNMALPASPFHAGGVSRRSSLRFVLDAGGLAYFVDDNKQLMVTTEPLARVKWMTALPKPSIEDLKSESRDQRREAAFALGELGVQANDAIDALTTLLESKDLTLREAATCALGKIGPKALVRLGERIYDPDPAIALAAIKAQVLLMSDSAGIRAFAANAIGDIGPHGQVCEPELQNLLSDTSIAVRREAAYAMARIDLPSDASTIALEAAAKDSEHHVTLWAKAALRVIKSKQ